MKKLLSTTTGIEYPFDRIEEFAENGESLEVFIPNLNKILGYYLFPKIKNFSILSLRYHL